MFPEHVRKLWNNWELRLLVLVSLTLQLCLLHFGSRRRYSDKTWTRVFLWFSYLGADTVATVALGVISSNQGNRNDSQFQNDLIAFWAPFMLLHLGGQDTITAYAVQDNELWLRHLLGLVVQTGVALYIFLLSWKVSWLSFLTIPMFLAGSIKYAERIWVLKSANHPIPMTTVRDYSDPRDIIDSRDPHMHLQSKVVYFDDESQGMKLRRDSFQLFEIFSCLFLNQKVSMYNRLFGVYSGFITCDSAWKTIEDELGYAYDVHYTKAPLFFTAWGFLFRFISFTSILFVFVFFLIKESYKHPLIDLVITYLLLVGAIFIEIYAAILLCASSWPWPQGKHTRLIRSLIDPIRNSCAKLSSKKRWSNSLGQLDLLGFCLKDKPVQVGQGTPKLFASLREWAFNLMLSKLSGELEIYCTRKQVS